MTPASSPDTNTFWNLVMAFSGDLLHTNVECRQWQNEGKQKQTRHE